MAMLTNRASNDFDVFTLRCEGAKAGDIGNFERFVWFDREKGVGTHTMRARVCVRTRVRICV